MSERPREFQAIVLAGGFGTRLRSVSGETPKPMMPVGGMPFVYHILKRLEKCGAKSIVLALHYNASQMIKQILNDCPVECDLQFSVERVALGTGGAIKQAAATVVDESFLVVNGDTYLDIDYFDLKQASVGYELFMGAVHVDDRSRYGAVQLSHSGDVQFLGKGFSSPGPINSGAYVVSRSSILSFQADQFAFEEDYAQHFSGSFGAKVYDTDFIDIGVPEDYFNALKLFG